MIFSKYRKKRAIKKYLFLVNDLKKRYGKGDYYTFLQVKKTSETKRLSNKFLEYLYALYLDSSEFSINVSSTKTYNELREEIAVLHLDGNVDFSLEDIIRFVTPVQWGGGRVDIVRTRSGTFRQ